MRLLIVLTTLSVSGCATSDPCEFSVDWLLEQYVEARGGYEAIERQRALKIVSTNHEGQWNPRFDYRVMKPGYMWIEAVYDDGETIWEGFDGERGWEKWGDKPAEYVAGDAGKGLNQGAMSPVHLYGLHHMESLGAQLETRGCARLEGSDYYVLNVLSAFGTDLDYYINAGTFRLERSRTVRPLHPTIDPTPITIEERWINFKPVGGVLHPFGFSLINVDTDEVLSWLEVHSIENAPELTAEFFAKPE